MKKSNLIVVFIFLFANTFAQVSGYLGKRAVVSYSNYFMFGFRGPGPNYGSAKDEFSPTLNNTHCLNFEYAQKQRVNICASFQYLRTGIAYDRGQEIGIFASDYVDPYCYPGRTRYKGDYFTPAKLTSLNFGLAYKLFNRGYIAPLGTYQKVEFLLLFETVTFDNKNFYVESPVNWNYDDVLVNVGPEKYNYRNVVLSYSIGRSRIFYNRIVLDYGVRCGIAPSGIIPFVFSDYADTKSTMERHFRTEANRRIFRQQLFNFHLGIGFLAF